MYRRFQNWLYLPEAYTGLISRLTGLSAILFLPVIWVWTHAGSGIAGYPMPYNVPAYKVGNYLLQVPLPAEPVNLATFAFFVLCSFMLIIGKGRRWLYLYMLAFILYYCSRDFLPACYHWIILPTCYLGALALNNKGSYPARRLIQVAVVSCYLLGVVQKLTIPDFWQGHTFASFFDKGWALNGLFKPFFAGLDLPLSFWAVFSCSVLLVETYIGLGLCFKKTRFSAIVLGLLLHGGIALTMDFVIAIFTLVMWTGYIAFYEKRSEISAIAAGEEQPATSARLPQTALSAIFIAVMLLVPLRIYLPGEPTNDVLTLFDRTPWAYTMFILRQDVNSVKIELSEKSADGTIRQNSIEPFGRMLTTSTVNDMISLARYVIASHPDALTVDVQSLITVNRHRYILKKVHWSKPAIQGGDNDISAFTYSATNIPAKQHLQLSH